MRTERRRCFGTDETRSGTSARHSGGEMIVVGTANIATGTRAITLDTETDEPGEDDSRRCDEAAQQLSACVWLTSLFEECS